ncbi:low molecular weight phosphatase family protein [Pontibacter sp. CAU 1760]
MDLYPQLHETAQVLTQQFELIPASRKQLLQQLAHYVKQKLELGQLVQLNFICTHNSRRSHMAQLWAQAAAAYYQVPRVACFSGGTEATAFNPGARKALQQLGFRITQHTPAPNPVYHVAFGPESPVVKAWSKEITDAANPQDAFGAVMTCSDADQNCPYLPHAEIRLPLTFEDPKAFDGTAQEEAKYLERAQQIGRELLYAFSFVKLVV